MSIKFSILISPAVNVHSSELFKILQSILVVIKQLLLSRSLLAIKRNIRCTYGQEHQHKNIEEFWANIYFTDEPHIDLTDVFQLYILREEGTRYEAENMQEFPEREGVKLRISAWVKWYRKAEKLEFYNDENDHFQPLKRPSKPRKSRYESNGHLNND
jgi:hypothetical protein